MKPSPSSGRGHVCPLTHTQSPLPSPLPTHRKSPYSGLTPLHQYSAASPHFYPQSSPFPIIQVRHWYSSGAGQPWSPSLLLALFGPVGAMGRGVSPSSPPHRSPSLLVQLCRTLFALQHVGKTPVSPALPFHFSFSTHALSLPVLILADHPTGLWTNKGTSL